MQRMKNIKIWIGLTYLLILSAFLFFLFSNVSFQQITDFDFIKSQTKYLINLRESNLFTIKKKRHYTLYKYRIKGE